MLRRLAAYPRQNGLAVALREIGRVERSLFTLDWLRSGELRRRANAGLNKGEARNALARAVSGNIDADHPGHSATGTPIGIFQISEDRQASSVIDLAFDSRLDMTRGALEEARSEPLLECLDC